MICKAPCVNGIYTLTGGTDWYTPEMRKRVIALGREQPERARQFHDAIMAEDYAKFWQLFDEICPERKEMLEQPPDLIDTAAASDCCW